MASSFFSKKTRDWDGVASYLIPLFAKNSRLGYFLNAKNLGTKTCGFKFGNLEKFQFHS